MLRKGKGWNGVCSFSAWITSSLQFQLGLWTVGLISSTGVADDIFSCSFHLLQAVYHNVKPASLQQQLEAVHMSSEKAEIFSQAWATNGPELVERVKLNIFTPKKVRPIYKDSNKSWYSSCWFFCVYQCLRQIYPHIKMQCISRTSQIAYTLCQKQLLLFE